GVEVCGTLLKTPPPAEGAIAVFPDTPSVASTYVICAWDVARETKVRTKARQRLFFIWIFSKPLWRTQATTRAARSSITKLDVKVDGLGCLSIPTFKAADFSASLELDLKNCF